jgi:hypothetical protein
MPEFLNGIALNGTGLWKFYLLSSYVLVSGIYDLGFTWGLFDRDQCAETVRGLLFAGVRFLVGLSFLIPTLVGTLGRTDVLKTWDDPNIAFDTVFWMMAIYVALKASRFFYLARLPDTAVARGGTP